MPPTQPDHCSAGAGSTGQSKQRAGSGPSQSVRSAKRASAAVQVLDSGECAVPPVSAVCGNERGAQHLFVDPVGRAQQ
jgi:hypothetical protein